MGGLKGAIDLALKEVKDEGWIMASLPLSTWFITMGVNCYQEKPVSIRVEGLVKGSTMESEQALVSCGTA